MRLETGDPAPMFTARSDRNPDYNFSMAAGRYLVLSFISPGQADAEMLGQLSASGHFDDRNASLFIVTSDRAHDAPGALPLRLPGVRAFFDQGERIAQLYRLSARQPRPVSFILSPRLQVTAVIAGERSADRILAALDVLPRVETLPADLAHAPVLIIPGVFEPALCERLIAGYLADGGRESGFMRDIDGKTMEVRDPSHKVRRDWNIPDSQTSLIDTLQDRVMRRIVPEIGKAYQFEVTRMERYVVSCYDADSGGHFRPHRDNTTKGTAHRRFAVSINLNAEDYEGGNLRFPEFGHATYRPPTGGACVFSCSLLHEATRITTGVRYAFLPFLYDEAARRVRDENLRFVAARET